MTAAALVALGLGLLDARPAEGYSPFLVVPEPAVVEASPAYRYANMTNEEALAELDRRQIPYARAGAVPGVREPVRLTGRLHGVYIHSALPLAERATSLFEVLDARLALSLDDFAALLERHDIDEVVHYTMYRPNVPKEAERVSEGPSKTPRKAAPVAALEKPRGPQAKKSPAPANATARPRGGSAPKAAAPARGPAHSGKPAPKPKTAAPHEQKAKTGADKPAAIPVAAPAPVTRHWAPPGTRHPAGLAIDVGMLHKKDGTWISVAGQFHGNLGAQTCGGDVPQPAEGPARELRALVCESRDQSLFTYILTPNYDVAHADHFHMEIKPGVRWFLVH